MRGAGCNNFPRCPMSMGQLERVWEANRSALDMPVARRWRAGAWASCAVKTRTHWLAVRGR